MPSLNPTLNNTTESPLVDVRTSKPQDVESQEEGSQDSYYCPLTNGENRSVKSWSPETYNGSLSAEEDEAEYNLVRSSLSKSCEHSTAMMQDETLYPPLSSSLPDTTRGRKKSLKAWLTHKIKKKQKHGVKTDDDDSLHDREVHRVGSYTRKVGHITEKYEKISKEKKMREATESATKSQYLQPLSSDSPLLNHIPSGAEEFKSLPLYSQMKYKLSIILQNIHIPKPSFVSSFQSSSGIKLDLILLLEECMSRSLWTADSSEYGVIKEVLDTVTDLEEDW